MIKSIADILSFIFIATVAYTPICLAALLIQSGIINFWLGVPLLVLSWLVGCYLAIVLGPIFGE